MFFGVTERDRAQRTARYLSGSEFNGPSSYRLESDRCQYDFDRAAGRQNEQTVVFPLVRHTGSAFLISSTEGLQNAVNTARGRSGIDSYAVLAPALASSSGSELMSIPAPTIQPWYLSAFAVAGGLCDVLVCETNYGGSGEQLRLDDKSATTSAAREIGDEL